MKKNKKIKKIFLIDFLIFLPLILLLFFFFLFFYRKSDTALITVKVTNQDVLYAEALPDNWYANQFHVGDVEKDTLGRNISEIVGIRAFNVNATNKAVYLNIKVRATYDTRTKTYTARGRKLVYGTPMRFYFDNVVFDGFVTRYPGIEDSQDIKILMAEIELFERYVDPELIDGLYQGKKIFDINNDQLAEITSIEFSPAKIVLGDNRGAAQLSSDPLYKDIRLILEVKVTQLNDDYFIFDNIPLKIGQDLDLNFNDLSMSFIVVDFKLNN